MVAKQTTSPPSSGSAGSARPSRPAAPAAARPVGDPNARMTGPSIVRFVEESRAELRKVTWPTRQEVQNLTLAVIGMTVFVAVFLGIIDEILNYIITPLIGAK
jgi:preprotein translocase subunit SecE